MATPGFIRTLFRAGNIPFTIIALACGKNIVHNAWPIHDFVHGREHGKKKYEEEERKGETDENENGSPLVS